MPEGHGLVLASYRDLWIKVKVCNPFKSVLERSLNNICNVDAETLLSFYYSSTNLGCYFSFTCAIAILLIPFHDFIYIHSCSQAALP